MLPFFLTLLPFQLCWPSPSFSYPFCEVSSGFITGRQEVNAATCLLSVPNPTINRQRLCKEVTWLAAAAAAVVSYSIVSAAWTEVLAKNFIVCSSSQLRSVVREIGVVGELVLFNWTMVAEICACGESGKWGLPVTQKKVELRSIEWKFGQFWWDWGYRSALTVWPPSSWMPEAFTWKCKVDATLHSSDPRRHFGRHHL